MGEASTSHPPTVRLWPAPACQPAHLTQHFPWNVPKVTATQTHDKDEPGRDRSQGGVAEVVVVGGHRLEVGGWGRVLALGPRDSQVISVSTEGGPGTSMAMGKRRLSSSLLSTNFTP